MTTTTQQTVDQDLSKLQRAFAEMAEKQRLRDQQEQIDAYVKLMAKMLDPSLAYTKGVITVGYAALFATWGFVRASLSPRQNALAGLLILTSALVFVLWEVYSTLTTTAQFSAWAANLRGSPQEAITKLREFEQKTDRVDVARSRGWHLVVATALLTAIAAVGILTWGMLRVLFLP